ncbi:NAD(P)-binding protein [Ramaria rubella]|nr:NAD(P)-binding protein [Ramaria rubella]
MDNNTRRPLRIVITGCSGSVGCRVVQQALKEGHSVLGVDKALNGNAERQFHPNLTFVAVDLRDFDATVQVLKGCDAVIHLAAFPNPGDYEFVVHNSNVVVSWNILRAAAELKITRIAQASSVNAIGLVYSSGMPTFDYFPLDEEHPCRPDEPYGLSKQICELQADAIVRRYPFMRIASLRLHWSVPNSDRPSKHTMVEGSKQLWGWVQEDEAARAFLLAVASDIADFQGHESFFIVAPETATEEPSIELARKAWPNVKIRRELKGREGFFDCSKAKRLLGWVHISSYSL